MRQSVVFVAATLTMVTLLGLAALEMPPQGSGRSGSISGALSSGANYLAINYNPALGLISETPGSTNYWLYSDNFLASLALSEYGQGNATLTAMAANISTTLNGYSDVLNGAENQYMTLTTAPCQFPTAGSYNIQTSDGVQVKTTLNNGTGTLTESQYADIAFLKAVCLYQQGNFTQALQVYNVGRGLFDGVGFRDLPYNETGQYQTYKLALFIFASIVMKQPVEERAVSLLLSLQAQNGGFYTGYDSSYSTGATQTNTETTSLAILALNLLRE